MAKQTEDVSRETLSSPWFVYMLKCADNTLYTGITTDLEKRLMEHNTSPKGAKYTRGRRPVEILGYISCTSRSEASQEEARLKRLSRREKLDWVTQPEKRQA